MEKILRFWFKRPYVAFFIVLSFFCLGIFHGTSIPLNLSLASLLPKTHRSVADLDKVTTTLGGIGFLTILVGPMENPQNVLPEIELAIKDSPDIHFSYYQREDFFLKNKYLYLIKSDEFNTLIKHARNLFSKKGSAIDLTSDDVGIQEKRKEKASQYFLNLKKDLEEKIYYTSKDKKYAMFLIKPSFDSTDLKQSKLFTDNLKRLIDKALPKNTPYSFVGRYVDKVQNTEQFKKDIFLTGTLSMAVIALLLFIGLGSIHAVIFVITGVSLSLGITVGMANFFVGQINILTGFLLAILGGLGSEYGIHFVRRYFQFVGQGISKKEASEKTYLEMGRSLFSAALTSAIAFLILIFSDFKGFSELGIIAGFGILIIYFVFILSFPIFSRFLKPTKLLDKSIEKFGFYPFTKKWAFPLMAVIPFLLFGITRAEFEYDFERMADSAPMTQKNNELINKLFEHSMTPAVVLARDKAQVLAIEDWIENNDPDNLADPVVSLNSLLPLDMSKRYSKIKKISESVAGLSDFELEKKTGLKAQTIRDIVNQKPFLITDLPLHLQKMFSEDKNIIYVYPKENLRYAKSINRFADFIKKIRTNFEGSYVGSGFDIFSDILHHIIDDGKIVLIMFLISAFFIFWLDFRSLRQAFILELQLIFGVALLVGSMGLFNIRFTILNVAMIPAVLAAGIDIGVHMMHQEASGTSPIKSAQYIAQAVQLSVLTTLAGFAALFFAQAKMLQGIAWISVLGQMSMYFICMLFIPIVKEKFLKKS